MNLLNKFWLLFLLTILFHSCTPKVKTNLVNDNFPRLETGTKIFVVAVDEAIPEASNYVGDLKVGDTGFSTECGYKVVLDYAKEAAKASGANLIKLISLKKPNLGSTCYRLEAKLYRNLDEDRLGIFEANRAERNKSRLPEDADYAVVYFYRPRVYAGSAIGYKIRLNDETVIGRVRNGEKFEYKITDFGMHTFWGKTESRSSVSLDVQKGQEYFIRCGVQVGELMAKPELYLEQNVVGIAEYDALK